MSEENSRKECPKCGEEMERLELSKEGKEEFESAWACNNDGCVNMITMVVREDSEKEINPLEGLTSIP